MGFFVPQHRRHPPGPAGGTLSGGAQTECFHVAQLPILTIVPSNEHVGALLERLERAHLDETRKDAWLASEAPAQPPDGHTFCSVSVGPEYQVGDRFLLTLATGHALKLEVQEGWPGSSPRRVSGRARRVGPCARSRARQSTCACRRRRAKPRAPTPPTPKGACGCRARVS